MFLFYVLFKCMVVRFTISYNYFPLHLSNRFPREHSRFEHLVGPIIQHFISRRRIQPFSQRLLSIRGREQPRKMGTVLSGARGSHARYTGWLWDTHCCSIHAFAWYLFALFVKKSMKFHNYRRIYMYISMIRRGPVAFPQVGVGRTRW